MANFKNMFFLLKTLEQGDPKAVDATIGVDTEVFPRGDIVFWGAYLQSPDELRAKWEAARAYTAWQESEDETDFEGEETDWETVEDLTRDGFLEFVGEDEQELFDTYYVED